MLESWPPTNALEVLLGHLASDSVLYSLRKRRTQRQKSPDTFPTMFEPQLFGLLAKDYLGAAQTLLAPALGFAFLYLLQLPLKKLPFVASIVDYRPPTWLLPIFALGTSFLFMLFLAISISLQTYQVPPPAEVFVSSFQRTRDIQIPDEPGRALKMVEFALDQYDGRSDFRVFVNGYRVFGSSSNCMLSFQCRDKSDPDAATLLEEFKAARLGGNSFLHVFQLYALPHLEDITHFLLEGDNIIDIHSSNTGARACNVATRLILTYSDSLTRQYRIVINWESKTPPASGGRLLENEELFAGGPAASFADGDEVLQIEPYRTPKVRIQFRLCERVRIRLKLASSAAHSFQDEPAWSNWARSRVTRIKCELESGPEAKC